MQKTRTTHTQSVHTSFIINVFASQRVRVCVCLCLFVARLMRSSDSTQKCARKRVHALCWVQVIHHFWRLGLRLVIQFHVYAPRCTRHVWLCTMCVCVPVSVARTTSNPNKMDGTEAAVDRPQTVFCGVRPERARDKDTDFPKLIKCTQHCLMCACGYRVSIECNLKNINMFCIMNVRLV